MKRAFVAILAILYLTATSGVALNVHWCMGKIAGTSVALGAASAHHTCGRCGMEKSKKGGCCHDEHKIIRSGEDQSLAAQTILHFSAPVLLPVSGASIASTPAFATEQLLVIAPAHGPPHEGDDLPIYLQVRSLRI